MRIKNRRINFKEVKKPVLIVCEDSKSSVLYFKSKIKHLYLNPIDVEVDGNSDSSPVSVVKYAMERKKKNKNEKLKKRV